MALELGSPATADLHAVVGTLRDWQAEQLPTQLHPGDIGWNWRHGERVVAAAMRTWTEAGLLVAVGYLDSQDVLRLTVAPDRRDDEIAAMQITADIIDPDRGVLPAGAASVEVPNGYRLPDTLAIRGWLPGEAWTPLRRDLSAAVNDPGLHVEIVGADLVSAFTAVHRSAWDSSHFTDTVWHAMAVGPAFVGARCLLGIDSLGVPVAGATVWSAGPGRPGLVEPVGVHAEHRGHGYGRMIAAAAAVALRKLGSSSAEVCTPTALVSAVATYRSAGFTELPQRLDQHRYS